MGQFDNVLGPLILAAFVNTYVCGLVGFQIATYIGIPYHDPKRIKSVVAALFSIDFAQTIIIIYAIWMRCVENYKSPSTMERTNLWTNTSIPLFIAASSLISHVFIASQIYERTKNLVARRLIDALSIIAFGLAVATGVIGLQKQLSSLDIIQHTSAVYRIVLICWIAIQFISDGSISVVLLLDHSRSKELVGLLSEPSSAFDLLIRTNSFGTLFSLLSLLLVFGVSKSLAYIVVLLPLGRLYTAAVIRQILLRPRPVDPTIMNPMTTTGLDWSHSNMFSLALGNKDTPNGQPVDSPTSNTRMKNLRNQPKAHQHQTPKTSNRLKDQPSLSLIHVKTEQSIIVDSVPELRRSHSVTQSRRTSVSRTSIKTKEDSGAVSRSVGSVTSGLGSVRALGGSDEDMRDFKPRRSLTAEEREILKVADGSHFNKKRVSQFPSAR